LKAQGKLNRFKGKSKLEVNKRSFEDRDRVTAKFKITTYWREGDSIQLLLRVGRKR
jgi:hypothetical protein